VRPPLNADCSIHLTPFESPDGETTRTISPR